MTVTAVHRNSLCSKKKVRAISGSPANFWPVWFQRLAILVMSRIAIELTASSRALSICLRLLQICQL